MKIQEINTDFGLRYLLIDNNFLVVDEVKRFLKFLDITGKSPNTLKNYAYHLKTFYEYMEKIEVEIKNISTHSEKGPIEILSDFIFYLQYPDASCNVLHINGELAVRGDKTVNIIVNTVLSFYQYLAKNNELVELDIYKTQRTSVKFKSFLSELVNNKIMVNRSIFKKREIRKEIKFVTRAQFNLLVQACNNNRDKLLLSILYEGGLRINEALGIHLSDLCDIQDGIIKIVPRNNNENKARVKNFAGGIIKMPDYVIDMISSYIIEDHIDYEGDFFFINLYGYYKNKPMSVNNAEDLFRRLSKKVGFHVNPHMLRHGFATEKLNFGWSMEDISFYLRHKNIQSTQIYAHYSDDLKKEKMRVFFSSQQLFEGVNEEYE